MNLEEKSERIKEELDILKNKYGCIITAPNSINKHTQEWQYLITYERIGRVCQKIKVNVHMEYIDVFISLPPKRFDGDEQVKDAIEWVEVFLRNP